jgi:transcriptional regulator with XRE-family HTH domain
MDEWRTRLREAINRTGKKYCAVAWEAGIDPTTLSRLLTGTMHKPSFQTIVNVTHATGETVGWILGEYGYSISEEERKKLRDAAATIIEVTSAGRVLRKDTPARKIRRTRS